jgi:hypothetical protein
MDGNRNMTPNQIIVGPINRGLQENRTAFVIDNDSFPVLQNAYQWRGRVLRKRGTSFLNRLSRFVDTTNTSYSSVDTIIVDADRNINLITGFGLEASSSFVPTMITLTDTTSGQIFTDPAGDGILVGNAGGSGTINYASGIAHFNSAGSIGHLISASFVYYPGLPVLGLEYFNVTPIRFSGTLAFDNKYAYNISPFFPYRIYDVSFYKISNVPYNLYAPKTDATPFTFNGQTYQQFWSQNYQGAFWVTNGVQVPLLLNNIGMQFASAADITFVSRPDAQTIIVTIVNCPLVVGDFVFLNEWTGTSDAASRSINLQTGYVTAVAGNFALLTVTIKFPLTTIISPVNYVPGIIQYLTNRSDNTLDCIRWYDGDPTNGANPTVLVDGQGWVNFMPPLSRNIFSIAQLPLAQYYLVGARLIQDFKDRLLFIGPVVQAANGSKFYLQDTVIYSQNGTPYYTSSFNGDPSLSTTVYSPVLVPDNQTAAPNAWWEDQPGFGGFIVSGIDQPILSSVKNEDVLLLGAPFNQMRLVYTGNDLLPFQFYLIDSELSTNSSFSTINMGHGSMTRGERGIIITNQREAKRMDLDIPDQIFEINLLNNGAERFTGQRDFLSEWVYYTYNSNQSEAIYPSQTLLYNYRDHSWAIFNESYTHYGQFVKRTGLTWGTVGAEVGTWSAWNNPWSSSTSSVSSAQVIAGNQQGFVVIRQDAIKGNTYESDSLFIQAINNTTATITSIDHGLNENDYIVITGCMGVTALNGKIFSVQNVTQNTFDLNSSDPINIGTGTYIGGGLIKKMYVPFIQTKQFPAFWNSARKTRIGVQRYLFTTTRAGKVQLFIYLSQSSDEPFNGGPIFPKINSKNDCLIYTTTVFTCPESTNLGLTPANASLMMISDDLGSSPQSQIWHRLNTSLIGDTVQLGFTLSDEQMRDINFTNQFVEIELHGFTLDVYPSQMLC